MPYPLNEFGRSHMGLSGTVLVAATVFLVACATVTALSGSRQSVNSSNAPLPSFEVASIKPNHSGKENVSMNWGADTCKVNNVTVRRLIAMAYGVNSNDQISGASGWMNSETYDIDAKMEDSLKEKLEKLPMEQWGGQLQLLLQSLLADRFQLRVTHSTKNLPVFALVVAKNGPKLTPTTLPPDDPANARKRTRKTMRTPARGQLIAKGQPVASLLGILSREVGGRVVLDETGLTGEYDFKLQWSPETSTPISAGGESPSQVVLPAPDSSAPSIFTALQEQLGLKLESRKAPRDVIVIAHVERPSPN
jgi:uncharacterized protein (TIGR03435 family)